MTASHTPPGYPTLMPYLTVKGARQLQDFLVAVFDATIAESHEGAPGSIVHGAARIGGSFVEFADATGEWGPTPAALHVYVPDVDETHRKAVQAGATVLHEPRDQDYGERSSAVRDPLGNTWYIATYKG